MKFGSRKQGDVLVFDLKGDLVGGPDTYAIKDAVKEQLDRGERKILLNLDGVGLEEMKIDRHRLEHSPRILQRPGAMRKQITRHQHLSTSVDGKISTLNPRTGAGPSRP